MLITIVYFMFINSCIISMRYLKRLGKSLIEESLMIDSIMKEINNAYIDK
jgi:hypothetical protein